MARPSALVSAPTAAGKSTAATAGGSPRWRCLSTGSDSTAKPEAYWLGNRHTSTGRLVEWDTGLLQYRHRYMAPVIGRFVQRVGRFMAWKQILAPGACPAGRAGYASSS